MLDETTQATARSGAAKLSRATITSFGSNVRVPAYDRALVRPGIVHIGIGNFHRVHQATVIDDCLNWLSNAHWGISGVGLTDGTAAQAKAEIYRQQDNLYTVTELTSESPRETRVIGAMVEYLHAPSDPDAVRRRLTDPATRIVSLTITEGGYNIDGSTGEFALGAPGIASDLAGNVPQTPFGYLVDALDRRRREGLQPFTVLSCDNLRSNGDTTRKAVVTFARARDKSLADWIEAEGAFPNSMVDRIAPQVSDSDRQRLNQSTGVGDLIPATCEPYTKWVIEDRFCAGRPPLEVGGVEFSNDVAAYEAVKGRLSNAAHMLMCYPSLLMGSRTVDEGMRDPRISQLLRNFWDLDSLRLVTPPRGYSIERFTAQVLERFANPAIKDSLLRVAGDGASKINVFHAKTILQLVAEGADLTREAFLMATFARYLCGADDVGKPFSIFEPQVTAEDFALVRSTDKLGVLRTSAFRGLGLHESPAFVSMFLRMTEGISRQGTSQTLNGILR